MKEVQVLELLPTGKTKIVQKVVNLSEDEAKIVKTALSENYDKERFVVRYV